MVKKIIEELSYLEKKVLLTLKDMEAAAPEEIQEKGKFKELVGVMNASSWLKSKKLVEISEHLTAYYNLAKKQFATRDLPERRALRILKKKRGAASIMDLQRSSKLKNKEVPIAIGWLKRKGWATISKEKGETIFHITDEGKRAVDEKGKDEKLIELLAKGWTSENECDMEAVRMLLSRQDIVRTKDVIKREIKLTDLGKEVLQRGIELKEEVAQLTPRLIQTGKWREVELRKYDIQTFAPSIYGGKVHPLTDLTEQIKEIFLEMGFTEISGNYIQSCFWNMDALFIPQDHPARELQDTFYLSRPERIDLVDKELVEKIKRIHEHGGDTTSDGWHYEWNVEEAKKAILRTHTTESTIRYLSQHPEPPVKVFSIGRIFRNEATDATHLAELHQIEGIVMEKNANLKMLIGILKEFYKRMGFEKIHFRPGYFPYTEPSIEGDVLFEGKWLELAAAGIFRPEVTAPFGVKYPVLAWGLGLERLAMLKLGLDDIRKLYTNDIEWLRTAKI